MYSKFNPVLSSFRYVLSPASPNNSRSHHNRHHSKFKSSHRNSHSSQPTHCSSRSKSRSSRLSDHSYSGHSPLRACVSPSRNSLSHHTAPHQSSHHTSPHHNLSSNFSSLVDASNQHHSFSNNFSPNILSSCYESIRHASFSDQSNSRFNGCSKHAPSSHNSSLVNGSRNGTSSPYSLHHNTSAKVATPQYHDPFSSRHSINFLSLADSHVSTYEAPLTPTTPTHIDDFDSPTSPIASSPSASHFFPTHSSSTPHRWSTPIDIGRRIPCSR